MTTYYPISFTVPQYEDSSGLPYSGAVLKAYVAGTSTPLSMATDYTGATTSATAVLNAAGYPTVSGNVIIPHYSENYKLSLYPTAAAATANTGAIWTVDNNQISQFSTATRLINQATDTGAANAYVIAPDPAIAAYAVGQIVTLLPVNANTAASTLTVSGLATKDIKRIDGSALLSGDMLTTGISIMVYNGTSFILLNPKSAVLSDTTIGNSSTSMHGYMPKLSNSATLYFDALGTQTNPALNAVLTGYTSGAGTVAATDTVLQAIQKLNGNAPVVTNSASGKIVFGAVTAQWGLYTGGSATPTITYGTAFSAAAYSIHITIKATSSNYYCPSVTATDVNGFSLAHNVATDIYWIAIGAT